VHIGDCQAAFSIGPVAGVAIGFNNTDLTPDFREIKFALYFVKQPGVGSQFVVMESGVQKTGWASYQTTDVFTIRRVGGIVTYWKGGTLIYTSATPSNEAMFLDTSLYAAGDYIA
jgi:hypothetical protein